MMVFQTGMSSRMIKQITPSLYWEKYGSVVAAPKQPDRAVSLCTSFAESTVSWIYDLPWAFSSSPSQAVMFCCRPRLGDLDRSHGMILLGHQWMRSCSLRVENARTSRQSRLLACQDPYHKRKAGVEENIPLAVRRVV